LKRLYEATDAFRNDRKTASISSAASFRDAAHVDHLPVSLLEAVFEVGDFDPLPQFLNETDDQIAEHECQVAVYPVPAEERLMVDRSQRLNRATPLHGTLVAVSMSGISFRLAESLPAVKRIMLRITNRIANQHVDAAAVVLRSLASANRCWTVICRFDKNLTFEQVHAIGRSIFAGTIV
jgi:hypothetical protein